MGRAESENTVPQARKQRSNSADASHAATAIRRTWEAIRSRQHACPTPQECLSWLWDCHPGRSALSQVWARGIWSKVNSTREDWSTRRAESGIPQETFGDSATTPCRTAGMALRSQTRLPNGGCLRVEDSTPARVGHDLHNLFGARGLRVLRSRYTRWTPPSASQALGSSGASGRGIARIVVTLAKKCQP